ncbi:hypothetical protein ABZV24_36090 [Streptomyces sp. NPDC005251]
MPYRVLKCAARQDAHPEQAAAAVGLEEGAARKELARFGRWSPYRAE